MSGEETGRRPPTEPAECRRAAENHLAHISLGSGAGAAIAWALLAIAGELAAIRRDLHKRR